MGLQVVLTHTSLLVVFIFGDRPNLQQLLEKRLVKDKPSACIIYYSITITLLFIIIISITVIY